MYIFFTFDSTREACRWYVAPVKLTPGGKNAEEVFAEKKLFFNICSKNLSLFLLSKRLIMSRRIHHIRCVDRVYFILLKNSFKEMFFFSVLFYNLSVIMLCDKDVKTHTHKNLPYLSK